MIFFHAQLLALERERTQKWVKMVKNWEKYIRGEKVQSNNFDVKAHSCYTSMLCITCTVHVCSVSKRILKLNAAFVIDSTYVQ